MLLLALFAGAAPAGVLDQLDALAKPERLAGQRDFLPPDQAFVLTESSAADGRLVLRWDIQPGYYLYRDKFKVTAATPGLVLGEARLAEGWALPSAGEEDRADSSDGGGDGGTGSVARRCSNTAGISKRYNPPISN